MDRSHPPDEADDDHADRPGTVVFSVDAELGWGHHDLAAPPIERIESARSGWIRLLAMFDDYGIPATWAVVGHLFLDACDGRHADHPICDDWFAREHGAWADRPDLRFGGDLIDRIRTADPDHEIGCHGFSHVEFGDGRTTPALARAELRASEAAAERSFDAFVFPRNNYGHLAVLADEGIQWYRGPRRGAPGSGPAARRAAKVGRGVLGSIPPLVEPRVDEYGMVSIPASMYLFDFEGPLRSLLDATVGDPVVRRVRSGVEAAVRTGGLLHLWLHPNNLYLERHARRMRAVLATVAERRAAGDLAVETMGQVAAGV